MRIFAIIFCIISSAYADGSGSSVACIEQVPHYFIAGKVGPTHLKLEKSSFPNNPKNTYISTLELGVMDTTPWDLSVSINNIARGNYSADETHNNGIIFAYHDTSYFKSSSVLINTYYNIFDRHELFVPYVGIGGGISRNTIGDINSYAENGLWRKLPGKNNVDFAWNLMAGTFINLNADNTLKLDVQYKYSDLGVSKTGDYYTFVGCQEHEACNPRASKLTNHALLVGLRYEF